MPARVASIEYDPNRSARIALLHYADGEKRYIVAPDGLKVGDRCCPGPDAEIAPGNCLPLRRFRSAPTCTTSSCSPGRASRVARSAGAFCQLMAKEGDYAQLRLPSGEVRKFHVELPRRRRSGRQPRSREHLVRQGGPDALAGHGSAACAASR